MREILFRGKRSDNGEWIEGMLLKCTMAAGTAYLIFADSFATDLLGNVHALDHAMVDPETVGQFTGLLDKNGRKIFEGDILNFSIMGDDGYFVVVSMENAAWGFYPAHPGLVHEDDQKWRSFWDPEYDDVWKQIYFTVIGNIYDNPELLGGDNNGVY